jgi:hypothetical protein
MHPFRSRACDGLSSLPCHLIWWIVAIVIQARPPFAMSGVLHGLDGEKAKAANTPHIIPGVGFGPSLRFSLVV